MYYNRILMIKFAVIGTSGASLSHLRGLQKSNYAECKYIYSRNIDRARKLAKKFNLIPTDDYNIILDDSTVEALTITTEPSRHANLAIKALDFGKHILIEKPIDSDIQRARKLLEAEKSINSSLVVSVISQYRFDPIILKMKKQLEIGAIDSPFLCEVKMIWNKTDEYYSAGNGWRKKYGNVLLNQGIHLIDLVVWFFGYPMEIESQTYKVNQNIDCFDTAIVKLKYSDNMYVDMVFSTAFLYSEPFQFNIYGPKGKLNYRNEIHERFNLSSNIQVINNVLNKILNRQEPPIFLQIEDFIHSIIHKSPPAVSLSEAYDVLNVVKECEKDFL